jgi:hypothetical protein
MRLSRSLQIGRAEQEVQESLKNLLAEQSLETRNRVVVSDRQPTYICSLAGLYENAIPTRFLAPIDFSQIPAQVGNVQHAREKGISRVL